MSSARHGEVLPLDLDLCDGMPGVALFLAYLGAHSGVERYTASKIGYSRSSDLCFQSRKNINPEMLEG